MSKHSYNIKYKANKEKGDTYRNIIRLLDQMILYPSDLFSWNNYGNSSVAGAITGSVGGILSGILTNKLIRFRMNPEKVEITRNKVRTTELTKGGIETFYWGENMVQMNIHCNTGWLRTYDFLKDIGIVDYRFSPGFLWLQSFEEFFKKVEKDGVYVNMLWDMSCYRGHLGDLRYPRDAENIWNIPFSFVFNAYPDKILKLTSVIPGLTGLASLVGSFTDSDDL